MSLEHAKIELSAAVAGDPQRQHTSHVECAKELVELGNRLEQLDLDLRAWAGKARPYLEKENPPLEFYGGMIKRFRSMEESLDGLRKLCITGVVPLSLRGLIELKMAVRMLFTATKQQAPCVVRVAGKKFYSSSNTKPTLPDPRKDPKKFKDLLEFLREKGFGDIIRPGQPLSYDEVSEALAKLVEKKDEMIPPWPEWLKVSVTPRITMADDK